MAVAVTDDKDEEASENLIKFQTDSRGEVIWEVVSSE